MSAILRQIARLAVLSATVFPVEILAATSPILSPLFLEITVNGHDQKKISTVTVRDKDVLLTAGDLADLGIKVDAAETQSDGLVDITTLKGITAKVQADEQELDITADNDRLLPQVFNLHPETYTAPMRSGHGFIGQYDVTGTVNDLNHAGPTSDGAGAFGGTYFSPYGNLTSNAIADTGMHTSQATRLDTTAEFDEPDTMRRWLVGDAVSGGPTWARSVRFAGLQVGTDFSMRPDLATFPLPAFFGQTAVPSTVDVFVNSARVFQSDINSGPFQIDNLPVITGNGQATVVVHDALGRETTAELSFYASDTLLREGLSSYDVDLGVVRQAYGVKNFDYGTPAATGTYAYGMTNALTLEAHTEATAKAQLAGGGASFSINPIGIIHIASAASTHATNSQQLYGFLHSFAVDSQMPPFGFFGSINATQGGYRDIASMPGLPPPKFQIQAGSNVSLGDGGSLAISWIARKDSGQSATQLTTATYALTFGGRWNFRASGFYDKSSHAVIAEASIGVALDDHYSGDLSSRSGHHENQQQVDFNKSVDPDGGFGYHFAATRGDTNSQQGEATWLGQHGRLDASLESLRGVTAMRLNASGGAVVMRNALYTTQSPNGSVALVRTGTPNASIFRENRSVATTDDDGQALLTGLPPFTPNKISIDPRDYSLSTIIDATEKSVVPYRQSGVVVDFTPPTQSPLLVVLRQENDNFPPVGARVFLDNDSAPMVVGRHGEVFVADLNQPITGIVQYSTGSCIFTILPPTTHQNNEPIPQIRPLPCVMEKSP